MNKFSFYFLMICFCCGFSYASERGNNAPVASVVATPVTYGAHAVEVVPVASVVGQPIAAATYNPGASKENHIPVALPVNPVPSAPPSYAEVMAKAPIAPKATAPRIPAKVNGKEHLRLSADKKTLAIHSPDGLSLLFTYLKEVPSMLEKVEVIRFYRTVKLKAENVLQLDQANVHHSRLGRAIKHSFLSGLSSKGRLKKLKKIYLPATMSQHVVTAFKRDFPRITLHLFADGEDEIVLEGKPMVDLFLKDINAFSGVTSLVIRGSDLRDSGGNFWQKDIRSFVNALEKMPRLTALTLQDTGLGGAAGIRKLAQAEGMKKIQYLDLRGNNMGDEGVKALLGEGSNVFAVFDGNPDAICTLNLSDNELKAGSAESLANWPRYKAIRYLGLGENDLGEDEDGDESNGIEMLMDTENRLVSLNLAINGLKASAAQEIASSEHMKNLLYLNLNENDHLGDEGVIALANSPFLKQLISLKLNRTGITTEGAEAFVKGFPGIHTYDLRNNEINNGMILHQGPVDA